MGPRRPSRRRASPLQDRYKIGGVERFFIRDPDGNRIEVQGPDGSGRSRWE